MTTELWALLGFAFWPVLLVTAIGGFRALDVLTGRKKANEFPAGVPHGGDLYWRLNRAHLNSLENLPIVASVFIIAHLAGVHSALTETLALVILGARIVQSVIHISSGTPMAVNLRFTAYVVQLLALAVFGFQLLQQA